MCAISGIGQDRDFWRVEIFVVTQKLNSIGKGGIDPCLSKEGSLGQRYLGAGPALDY